MLVPRLKMKRRLLQLTMLLPLLFMLGCGDTPEEGRSDTPETKYDLSYKGLSFYYQNKPTSQYRLAQLSDSEFNGLTEMQQLEVADKLLSTLFFGLPQDKLEEKIASEQFISKIRKGLNEDRTDKEWLENYILDKEYFRQNASTQEAVDILSRFYAMNDLDKYYLNNWTAYILTQTIMFSPAYELDSTHTPNISRVYNRLVSFFEDESGMRYTTYVHMMSEDNWRRFRSPEDNGREMMEIFLEDEDDAKVPLAGKALQNWKLNRDNDTLVVGRNENTEALALFGSTVYNGDDFYREMVKTGTFQNTVTERLVNFFFTNATVSKKGQVSTAIIASKPETFQDILLQIVFSKEYLLYNSRAKSAEELFYSLAKKMDFKHRTSTFDYFRRALEDMHQASMKYKLGKTERVPLDTLSFAGYHKYIRENMIMRKSEVKYEDDYSNWGRQGWGESFVADVYFNFDDNDELGSLDTLVQYLFKSLVQRRATNEELELFRTHMQRDYNGVIALDYTFDMFYTNDNNETKQVKYRESNKRNIATIVMDYLSRLDRFYMQSEVK